jgi:hypothetical protein
MAFAPIFQRPFSSPFDRRAAAAAAGVNWSQWFDYLWIAKGAASLAASYVDVVSSQSVTPVVAPTLGASGWVFAASAWMDTGLTWDSQSWSVAVFCASTSQWPFGCDNSSGAQRLGCIPVNVAVLRFSNCGELESAGQAALASGMVAMSGANGYRNATKIANGTIPAGTPPTPTIAIGGIKRGTGIVAAYTGTIAAFGFKKAGWTDANVGDIYDALAAL